MHGVYLAWLIDTRGFSPALVATILAAGDLAVLALEIPTGWFADRCGHRASLILGSSIQLLAMLAFWQARQPIELMAAVLLVALGDTFRSGADQALMYRSCAALGRETEFLAIEARTRAAGLVGLVALTLLGGALVTTVGFAAGWLVEVLCSAIGIALACAMTEPPAGIDGPIDLDDDGAPSDAASMAGPPRRRVIATLAGLVVPAALVGGTAGVASFLVQTTGHHSAAWLSLVVAFITLAEAAGAGAASRLPGLNLKVQWMGAGAGAAIVVGAWITGTGPAGAAITLSFLVGIMQPMRAAAIQRFAADHMRARAASLASACDMACSTLGLLVSGRWLSARRHRS